MDNGGTVSVYRISVLRRAGYPAAGLLALIVGAVQWLALRDSLVLRLCAVVTPFSALMWYYLNLVVLRIDERGVSLRWPLQEEKRIEWDAVIRVRRSDAPPGRNFFIDLMAGPDRSIQFNPFVFDRPNEIIKELDAHLKFELLGDDSAEGPFPPGGIALAAPGDPGPTRANWILVAALCALLAIVLVYLFK
jgi:hypothetical protein